MSLLITIKVTPRAGRSVLILDKAGVLRAYLKSPPEGGKANQELVKLLSKMLKCPQACVSIVQGETARLKTIHIDLPLSYHEFLSKLDLSVQTSLLG